MKLIIKHRSNGRGRLVLAERQTTQDIVATYLNGTVRTSGGEVWRVVKKATGWETKA